MIVVDSMRSCARSCGRAIDDFSIYMTGTDLETAMKKVHAVVMNALKYAVSTFLFLLNSSIWVLGLCIGFFAEERMRLMLDEIAKVFQKVIKQKELLFIGEITVCAVFAWPIAMAVAAFFMGANKGVDSRKYLRPQIEGPRSSTTNVPGALPHHETQS